MIYGDISRPQTEEQRPRSLSMGGYVSGEGSESEARYGWQTWISAWLRWVVSAIVLDAQSACVARAGACSWGFQYDDLSCGTS